MRTQGKYTQSAPSAGERTWPSNDYSDWLSSWLEFLNQSQWSQAVTLNWTLQGTRLFNRSFLFRFVGQSFVPSFVRLVMSLFFRPLHLSFTVKYRTLSFLQVNVWKTIYLNCGERDEVMIDYRIDDQSYLHYHFSQSGSSNSGLLT